MKIESFNRLDKNNKNKILQERNLLGIFELKLKLILIFNFYYMV